MAQILKSDYKIMPTVIKKANCIKMKMSKIKSIFFKNINKNTLTSKFMSQNFRFYHHQRLGCALKAKGRKINLNGK